LPISTVPSPRGRSTQSPIWLEQAIRLNSEIAALARTHGMTDMRKVSPRPDRSLQGRMKTGQALGQASAVDASVALSRNLTRFRRSRVQERSRWRVLASIAAT
jgi:hypothetical protein